MGPDIAAAVTAGSAGVNTLANLLQPAPPPKLLRPSGPVQSQVPGAPNVPLLQSAQLQPVQQLNAAQPQGSSQGIQLIDLINKLAGGQ